MRTTLLRTIPRASVNALAYQGIMPCDCFSQIFDTLERQFGLEIAQFFSEPVFNSREGFIDWYIPFEGEIRPYSGLSGDEKKSACATISAIASQIETYANTLLESADAKKITRGNILLLALRYPSENDLFLVGDRPVLTCWGFASGTQGAPLCNLCELGRSVKTEPAPIKQVQSKAPKSLWLLPLLLALLLFLLLFSHFGSLNPVSGVSLLHLPNIFPQLAKDEELLKEISASIEAKDKLRMDLEKKVLEHIALCREKPQFKPKQELVIPENVQDTSFMKGHWLCETGLYNATTKEPVSVEFLFEAQGTGIGRIIERNDVCSGSASVSLENNILHITHGSLRCARSQTSYRGNSITCQNTSSGKTLCRGQNEGGDAWDATFTRLP